MVTSKGDVNEEIVKRVAKAFPGGNDIKSYLGRDSKLVGSIKTTDLPQIVAIQASHRAATAESTVLLLTLAVKLLTGKGNASESVELLGELLNKVDLLNCIQNSVGPLADGNASAGQVLNAGAGCFGTLFELIAKQFSLDKLLWRITWVADALKGVVDTALMGLSDVWLMIANDVMKVQVVTVAPPAPKPSLDTFVGEWASSPPPTGMTINRDGTGTRHWALDYDGLPAICQGNASLSVKSLSNGFRATYTSVWYTGCRSDDSSERYTPPTVRDDPKSPQAGYALTFTRVNSRVIQSQGSGYKWNMCRTDSPEWNGGGGCTQVG